MARGQPRQCGLQRRAQTGEGVGGSLGEVMQACPRRAWRNTQLPDPDKPRQREGSPCSQGKNPLLLARSTLEILPSRAGAQARAGISRSCSVPNPACLLGLKSGNVSRDIQVVRLEQSVRCPCDPAAAQVGLL